MPFVPDADVGTDDLTAEGCGAWSCVQGLAAVKRHGQVCADGSLGGLTRIGVDAAGQIDGQHECAAFPLTIHQRTGSQPGVHLPPYSPDLNPIEKLWSKVKALLRKFKARTLDALPNAIQNAFHSVTVSDCSGWFRFCGYAL